MFPLTVRENLPTETETDGRRERFWEQRGDNPYYPFANEYEFNMGTFLAASELSEPGINELIKYNSQKLSFKNYAALKVLLLKVPYSVRVPVLILFYFIFSFWNYCSVIFPFVCVPLGMEPTVRDCDTKRKGDFSAFFLSRGEQHSFFFLLPKIPESSSFPIQPGMVCHQRIVCRWALQGEDVLLLWASIQWSRGSCVWHVLCWDVYGAYSGRCPSPPSSNESGHQLTQTSYQFLFTIINGRITFLKGALQWRTASTLTERRWSSTETSPTIQCSWPWGILTLPRAAFLGATASWVSSPGWQDQSWRRRQIGSSTRRSRCFKSAWTPFWTPPYSPLKSNSPSFSRTRSHWVVVSCCLFCFVLFFFVCFFVFW